MITVSGITKNTGRYPMIPHFLYSCILCFQFTTSCQVSAIAREETSEISRLGAGKYPHFRNSGSLFQSFLYAFLQGAGSCSH